MLPESAQTIAITGASGFVGRETSAHLKAAGYSVVPVRRNGGLLDPAPIREADTVIHLAGESISQRWSDKVKREIRESRVLGTQTVVKAMKEGKPRTLICASAIGYYGDRGEEELPETAPPGSGFLPDVCQEWEAEAMRAEVFGARVVRVRFGMVLGRNGGALAKLVPLFKFGLGGKLGDGRQWISWIHLGDLAGLIRFAMERPEVNGAWNGVAPNPVRNADFTRELAAAVNRPAFLPAPRFAVRLVFGEMAEIVFSSQRCVPERVLEAGYQFRFAQLGAALRDVVT